MCNSSSILAYSKQMLKRLQNYYQDEGLSDSYVWWMLEAVTGKTRVQLCNQSYDLSFEQKNLLEQWVHALTVEHMPIAYVLGSVPFCDLTISVKSPVLIPRQETELWCVELIAQCVRYAYHEPLQILDLCSGTGCIGLAFAKALPNAQITCVDNVSHALLLGHYNAQKNSISNVTFVDSDLFQALPDKTFDLIVSNPPYISQQEFASLEPSVKEWEDKHALVADEQGYGLIEKIIAQAALHLRYNAILHQYRIAQLSIEHGSTQAKKVVDLMRMAGYMDIQVYQDLAGKDRLVSGRRVHVAEEGLSIE